MNLSNENKREFIKRTISKVRLLANSLSATEVAERKTIVNGYTALFTIAEGFDEVTILSDAFSRLEKMLPVVVGGKAVEIYRGIVGDEAFVSEEENPSLSVVDGEVLQPETMYAPEDCKVIIDSVLSTLTFEERFIVVLAQVYELTLSEIARVTKSKEAAIISILNSARTKVVNNLKYLENQGMTLLGMQPIPMFVYTYRYYVANSIPYNEENMNKLFAAFGAKELATEPGDNAAAGTALDNGASEGSEEESYDDEDDEDDEDSGKRKKKGLLIFFILIILAGLGVGGYFVYEEYFTKKEEPTTEATTEVTTEPITATPTEATTEPTTEATTEIVLTDEAKLNEFISTEIIPTYGLADISAVRYEEKNEGENNNQVNIEGVVSAKIDDFDLDGSKELLVARYDKRNLELISDSEEKETVAYSVLVLDYYEVGDETIDLLCEIDHFVQYLDGKMQPVYSRNRVDGKALLNDTEIIVVENDKGDKYLSYRIDDGVANGGGGRAYGLFEFLSTGLNQVYSISNSSSVEKSQLIKNGVPEDKETVDILDAYKEFGIKATLNEATWTYEFERDTISIFAYQVEWGDLEGDTGVFINRKYIDYTGLRAALGGESMPGTYKYEPEEWLKAYALFLNNEEIMANIKTDNCAFAYIDDDDIPEIILVGEEGTPSYIIGYDDRGKQAVLNEIKEGIKIAGYIPFSSLISGEIDKNEKEYEEHIYKMTQGKLEEIAHGSYSVNGVAYNAFWNDESVMMEEYETKLKEMYDKEKEYSFGNIYFSLKTTKQMLNWK